MIVVVQNCVPTPVALLSSQKAKKDNAKRKEKEEKDRKAKERAVSILNFTQCALVTIPHVFVIGYSFSRLLTPPV